MIDYLLEHGIKSALFWIMGLIALWVASLTLMPHMLGSFPNVSQDKWQAVFLTNNQVYFGKITDLNTGYVALSHVYYLQTAADLSDASAAKLNLIKLGGEVHGPEDTIYIPKSSVLFFENMQDSSRVVQTIMSTNH